MSNIAIPGPAALGRGVVVRTGEQADAVARSNAFRSATTFVIRGADLTAPRASELADALHAAWARRSRMIVQLQVPVRALRSGGKHDLDLWALDEPTLWLPALERLDYLVWRNNYDARTLSPDEIMQALGGPAGDNAPLGRGGLGADAMPQWYGRKIALEAGALPARSSDADVSVDGRDVWVDGGPRGPVEGLWTLPFDEAHAGRLVVVPPAHESHADPHLDAAQLEAVTHPQGAVCVVAPAGSGKTRVLTARIRHLVDVHRVHPSTITAVAYNKRAQQELQRRLGDLAGPGQVNVQTVHALTLGIVNDALESKIDVLAMESERRRLVANLIPARPQYNSDTIAPYLDALDLVRATLRRPDEVQALSPRELKGFEDVFKDWRRTLADRRRADFADMIVRAIELLASDPALRARWQGKCRFLLVDEYQDSTPAFMLLFRLLASPALQVFCVGDEQQTIYGYSGATPEFLTQAGRWWPGVSTHRLTTNYRCAVPIVEATVNLLSHQSDWMLETIQHTAAPGKFEIVRTSRARKAATVADRIRDWLDETDASAIAVLARVNAALLPVQLALSTAGIPWSSPHPDIDGSSIGVATGPVNKQFAERTVVELAGRVLRIVASPDADIRGDDLRQVGARSQYRLRRPVLDQLGARPAWTVAELNDFVAGLTGGKRAAEQYLKTLEGLRWASKASTADILDAIERTGLLDAAIDGIDATNRSGLKSGHGDDFAALQAIADVYDGPHDQFVDWVSARLRGARAQPDGVHLSSIHRVKGLEWDRVIVFAVDDGTLPYRLSNDTAAERRVLHVAITRGKTQTLVVADERKPSTMLDELTQRWSPPARSERPSRAARGTGGRKHADRGGSGRNRRRRRPGYGGLGPGPVVPTPGDRLKGPGGLSGTVVAIEHGGVRIQLSSGATTLLKWGDRVQHSNGASGPLERP